MTRVLPGQAARGHPRQWSGYTLLVSAVDADAAPLPLTVLGSLSGYNEGLYTSQD